MSSETMDEREPGEKFCATCPDHEACLTGYPCSVVKRSNNLTCDGCGLAATVTDGIVGAYLCGREACLDVVWERAFGRPGIQERNLRFLKHEAETPMRGHDADGTCCRLAEEGKG